MEYRVFLVPRELHLENVFLAQIQGISTPSPLVIMCCFQKMFSQGMF
jgi:hypothetical protein